MYVCVCVYVYVCMCVYVYICIYICIHRVFDGHGPYGEAVVSWLVANVPATLDKAVATGTQPYVTIRHHTSPYVTIRHHTSPHTRTHTPTCLPHPTKP